MNIRATVEERLAQIAAGDPAVFTRVYRTEALAAADAADARRKAGISLGPLDGKIISIKDLFDVAGETTTAGSAYLRDAAPAASDALIVRRLRRAGAVIIGKTNMSEFAFSALGLNPHFGTPGNAADPQRIPGGSSAGAGVTVANGTSDISIGSDTGGSVRVPAALNGVIGFKPTARRIPLQGAFPLSQTLDSIGPLARTVADCARTDAIMAGIEPVELQPTTLAGLRIGVPRGQLMADLEPIVADAFDKTLERLSAAGASIIDHSIEDLLSAMAEASAISPIVNIEAATVHADHFDALEGKIDRRVHQRIALGRNVSAAVYIRLLQRRGDLIDAFDRRLSDVDVLACPTAATTAPLTAPLLDDDDAFTRANKLMLRNTTVGNFFDLTSISLPLPDLARPAGIMLCARSGQDQRLLEIAAVVEKVLSARR